MHGNGWHIIFNMFVLISFGPFLEKLWGPKRFAIMYLVSAVGAVLLYNGIGFYQVLELKQIIGNPDYIAQIDDIIRNAPLGTIAIDQIPQGSIVTGSAEYNAVLKYLTTTYVPMVGASGAIMGLMASFAILFPNTQLQLLFPPIPIKAKFLIGGYFLLDLYLSIFQQEGDNVAHLAHVGGAVAGAILVLIWRKRSNQFY
jgi:membrane associated rhomboid family serine protease